jgi:multimeric flavodoxin WrbA
MESLMQEVRMKWLDLLNRKFIHVLAVEGVRKKGTASLMTICRTFIKKIAAADRIIIASPIYFYGVTAQTKAFIDRCQALWSRKYLLKMRLNAPVPKIGYFLSVAATKGERVFEGAIFTVQYGLDAMDYSYGGELVVRGVDKRGVIAEIQEELDRAREFGTSTVLK